MFMQVSKVELVEMGTDGKDVVTGTLDMNGSNIEVCKCLHIERGGKIRVTTEKGVFDGWLRGAPISLMGVKCAGWRW